MSQKGYFTSSAKLDLAIARDWYEREREGLGFDFVDEVKVATRRIESNPLEFATVCREARICPVKRFPYIIVFRILDSVLEILAVIHGHRDPEIWRSRNS